MIKIRESSESNLKQIFLIHNKAFGKKEGKEINILVKNLFNDSTAKPFLSLIAFKEKIPVGHILFTKTKIMPENNFLSMLLAPLGVIPKFQKKGIGNKLIKTGLNKLLKKRIQLVFVLGHPQYYSRQGFIPAKQKILKPPYKLSKKNESAWMIKKLKKINNVSGNIICAKSLMKKKYWKE